MKAGSNAVLTRLLKLHPKRIDLSLDRIKRLLERLGNPQGSLPPVVHVAGTNGKGSVIAMMRAVFEAAGLKVTAAPTAFANKPTHPLYRLLPSTRALETSRMAMFEWLGSIWYSVTG